MTLESEQALVAAAITNPEQFEKIDQIISGSDFQDGELSVVWDAVTALRNTGRDVDCVFLAGMLDKSPRWEPYKTEGSTFDFLIALSELSAAWNMVEAYAQVVRGEAVTRRLKYFSTQVLDVAHEESEPDEKIGQISSILDEITDTVPQGFIEYGQAVNSAFEHLQKVRDAGNGLTGLSSGFEALDEITGGLQNQELIISAARPSQGKTALCMTVANHVARKYPVLVFSLEMSAQSLAMRSLAAVGNIDFANIKSGNIDSHVSRLTAATTELNNMNLRIDESGGLSVDALRTRARIAARKEKPRLIVIDYLTLLHGKGDNKTNEVGYIAESLKELAKEMDCPVWCLAQLNRGVEQRTDKRPKLSDLRDSGVIEQAADVVLFNYLDEKYNEQSNMRGWLELIVGKNRNGETGKLFLEWQGHYQKFVNPTRPVPTPEPPRDSNQGGALKGVGSSAKKKGVDDEPY